MINQERIKNLLLELVQIDSVSRKERDVAERIKQLCEEMGAEVEIDDAGEKVGGNSGNVIARFPGTIPGAEPIMMSAHMDTVVPGEGVKPIVEGDIIRTDGTTVLGGDDKSGCAVILETIRCLQEQNIPHAPIDAVFSICEEVGLLGAKHLDVSKAATPKYGIVFDSDDPGFLFTKGPSANHFEFKIHGLESHAGVAPEQGISAITHRRRGHQQDEALPHRRRDDRQHRRHRRRRGDQHHHQPRHAQGRGPLARRREARSADRAHAQVPRRRGGEIRGDGRGRDDEGARRGGRLARVLRDGRPGRLARRASSSRRPPRAWGSKVETMASGGGCDANIFNKRGIECANLGTGMRAIHTVKEWLDVKDMYASAEMTLEIMRLNGEATLGKG